MTSTPASPARSTLGRPYVIGHRGSPRAHPENTVESLRHALDTGADGVEFDVRVASDGIPVLAHDPDLRRTHKEHVPVDSLPATRLPLPTLRSVLAELADGHRDRILDIELKVPVPVAVIEEHLESVGWTGLTAITSFHAEVVRDYADTGWTAGLLVDDRRLQGADAAALIEMSNARFLGVRNPVFLTSVERAVHDAGAGLWLWTLNRRAHIKRAARRGVDAVITDYPEIALEVVQGVPVDDNGDGDDEEEQPVA